MTVAILLSNDTKTEKNLKINELLEAMMEKILKAGLTARITHKVTEQDTAANVGSGEVQVYATPKMLALMEKAAYTAVADVLPEGSTTVGTHLDASHLAATPVGMEVYATAELIEVDRKKLTYLVEAYDKKDCIGKGTHTRFIVDSIRFNEKAQEKLQK